jgi:hypothetical protein
MNSLQQVWRRLAKASRQATPELPSAAPYGFATRVAARWLAEQPEPRLELWIYYARQVMVGAAIVMVGVLALNYESLHGAWDALASTAPMVEIMFSL